VHFIRATLGKLKYQAGCGKKKKTYDAAGEDLKLSRAGHVINTNFHFKEPTMSKEIEIAAKMYDARRGVLFLIGEEKFKERVKEFRPMFQACSKADGLSDIETTIKLMKGLQLSNPNNGMAQMLLLASCVEIMEPSL
jgi:hypothetical protein